MLFALLFACDPGPKDSAAPLTDADADGSPAGEDCDDGDADAFPGKQELCDGVDNDCDGLVDDDALDAEDLYVDGDGDGYGADSVRACPGDGVTSDAGDCDDADPGVFPGAEELCDGVDQDCDGTADAEVVGTWYTDADGDGWGGEVAAETGCSTDGLASEGGDCDDADGAVHPEADDTLDDGIDQDCDGADATCVGVDLGDASGAVASGTTIGASDRGAGACADGEGDAFVWTAPSNGLWSFTVTGDVGGVSAREASCGGAEHACADDGVLRMWVRAGQDLQLVVSGVGGAAGDYELAIENLTPLVGRVSGGGGITCALDADDLAACYGLTYGSADPGPYVQVEAGPSGGCGIDGAGDMSCWGTDTYGESSPPSDTWAMVSSGLGISYCGLTTTGAIRCWGEPVNGSLSVPSTTDQQLISLGYYGGATVDLEGDVTVWGQSTFGMTAAPAGRYLGVSAGHSYVCGVLEDLSLTCWGTAAWGVLEPPEGEYVQVAAGQSQACALATDGSITCWGGRTAMETPPEGPFVDLTMGQGHACAQRATGEVECWGDDSYGQCDVP